MGALTIANGIVANLSAGSAMGNYVSKDYGVLDSCKDAAAVVGYIRGQDGAYAFGSPDETDLTMSVELFCKDNGSASGLLDNVLVYTDTVRTSLFSDTTLQGTVKEVNAIRYSRTPGEVFAPPSGTPIFLRVLFEIDVTQY